MNRRHLLALTATGVTAAIATPAVALFHAKAQGRVFRGSTPGIAIHGYDPVAYFTDAAPRIGNASFAWEWNGVRWHFANAANRDAFAAEPERYAPQYGGYCAFAAAKGSIAKIEPDAWSIENGKLYMNYSQSIRERWNGDRAMLIASADSKWPELEAGL